MAKFIITIKDIVEDGFRRSAAIETEFVPPIRTDPYCDNDDARYSIAQKMGMIMLKYIDEHFDDHVSEEDIIDLMKTGSEQVEVKAVLYQEFGVNNG